jgi:hypothetical protein
VRAVFVLSEKTAVGAPPTRKGEFAMSTKYESADLILRLYDLRREETMRKARDWFFWFYAETYEELPPAGSEPESVYLRMVTSYWDMAASFVNNGAIDEQMFADANAEHVMVFSKIYPFLPRIRERFGAPQYLAHLERLVMRMPDAETRLPEMRERFKAFAATVAARRAERDEG